MKHLSDTKIQDFLEGKGANSTSQHLQTCEYCQRQVEYYRILFAELEQPPTLAIPNDFRKTVVAQIDSRSAFFDRPIWQVVIPVFALFSGIGFTVYSAGAAWFKEMFGFLGSLQSFIERTVAISSQINIDFGLLGIGILSLILLTLLDRFVLKHNRT